MTTEKQKEPGQVEPPESAIETPQEHSSFQPKRRKRAKPGTKGKANISESLYGQRMNSPHFATRMLVKKAIFYA